MQIIIIFIIIFIVGIILYLSCNNIEISYFDSKKPGPKILFIAGTHGNEPSGYTSLLLLKNSLNNKKIKLLSGSLTIIYNLNKCGYYFDNRYYSTIGKNIDINRLYTRGFPINNKVEKIVDKHDIIIDFHEGAGYISRDKKSIGSSITSVNYPIFDVKNMISYINRSISEKYKKWRINNSPPMIPFTLRYYCNLKNKKYLLVETSGQKNIQPLHIRVNQNLKVIQYILQHQYKILPIEKYK